MQQRFVKSAGAPQPRVRVVPGLADHFGTLVRGTVRTRLPDHDVYLARLAQLARHAAERRALRAGRDRHHVSPWADLDEEAIRCVPVLAAAAIMAEDAFPAQPRSAILMGGPVDVRVNPGPVNGFADRVSDAVLDRTSIHAVPWPHRGAGRLRAVESAKD